MNERERHLPLPPIAHSVDVAAAWTRGVLLAEDRADLAASAERMMRHLVEQAIPRTPRGKTIEAELTLNGDVLRIEVRDPGGAEVGSGFELGEVSEYALSMGTWGGPDGHGAWAEIRPRSGATS